MKKLLFTLIFALPLALFAQNAKIKIDVDRTIGKIDPKIYGVFMEPINFSGRRMGLPDTATFSTLYGNLYDPSSPLADENGFRKDYIDAMKELKITNMRWPGGNFVMGYDWQDGIGPKDQRPTRINLAWGGFETNHVGTDEWIALNNAIGSENIICVNLGLATILDAAYWVEYCNYKKGSYYSDLRIKNGHKEPYSVKIWDLGNEVDGAPWELGHKNADDYVKIAREAAKAMQSVDHSIKFVASGSSYYESTGQWVEWNRKVLTGLGDMIDYISIHRYWERSDDYYTFMGQSAMDFEEKINVTAAEIEAVKAMKGFKNPIYISFDEYGVFGRNFLSILPIAQCLNSFVRHADIVKMANFTMMTSLLNTDRENGSFKTPLFHTFKFFSNNCLGNSIDTYVECDTFNTEKCNGIPYLDVTSTYSEETNTAYINVVNRHKDKTITSNIISNTGTFEGKAEIQLINAASLEEAFTFDKQNQYKPVIKEMPVNGNKMSCSFPAHSITQIKVKVKK
ncbi:alpha-N-arabinofuranosidase [candidate division KSB1 bacterium]|nr:alpha-N-arabinofuranosidase [candidate division KSB1 bacterium]